MNWEAAISAVYKKQKRRTRLSLKLLEFKILYRRVVWVRGNAGLKTGGDCGNWIMCCLGL